MQPFFIQAGNAACSFEQHVPAPCFRRAFDLPFRADDSKIRICGLGFYRLFVNGKEITRGHMSPYISNPDHVVYVDEYAVADVLQQGKNVIGIMLGNGLYNNFGGKVWRFDQGRWVGPPRFALEFCAEGEGQLLCFHADSQFRTHPSAIVFDDYRMGEWYDARRELPGWNLPGFDDSAWENAQISAAPLGEILPNEAEPIRISREIKPVSVQPQGDGWLYDFGENNAGVTRLRIRATPGQRITIRHGEYLHNGQFTIQNIIVQKPNITFYPEYAHKTVYIARGDSVETYEPSFAYYGFRYAYVEGITKEQATEDLLTFVVLHSDLRKIGGFSCSDQRANRLMEMAERSGISNFHYFPTDCPHREKNGWTGDARISAAHFTYLFDAERSYRQWLCSLRKCQKENGQLPGIVPTDSWGYAWGSGPAWDAALFELPYQLYRKKGALEPIRENLTAMVRYLHYIMSRRNENGTISIGLGDWAPVGKYANEYETPESVTDTITVLDTARKAAEMFRAVGEDSLAQWALELAQELRATARRELLEPGTAMMRCPTQTAQAMAIYYRVLEENEVSTGVQELLRRIHEKNDSFDCGMLGLHVLFHVLAEHGHAELAWHMIMKPDFPSYGYLLETGQTTLPEAFILENDAKHLDFSHNHHIFADIVRFYLEDVAGLKVLDSKTVQIAPHFIAGLENACGWHCLPSGTVEVKWIREADGIKLSVTAPQQVTCIPVLPADSNISFTITKS